MGRANHLSKAEKELIAYNYRKSGKSLGAIAKFLGRDRSSISRYKNYKLPKPIKETIKERKDIPDITKDKDEIIDMYTRPTSIDGLTPLEEENRRQMKRKHHG